MICCFKCIHTTITTSAPQVANCFKSTQITVGDGRKSTSSPNSSKIPSGSKISSCTKKITSSWTLGPTIEMEPASNGRLFVFVNRNLLLLFLASCTSRTLPDVELSTSTSTDETSTSEVTTITSTSTSISSSSTSVTSTTSLTSDTSTTSPVTTFESTSTSSASTGIISTSIEGEMSCDSPVLEGNCIEWKDGLPEIGMTASFNITVPPHTSETFILDTTGCGEFSIPKVDGIVVALELTNSKFCSADFTIACPKNISHSLYAREQCDDCEVANYSLEFRISGPADICKAKANEKTLVYFGNEAICEYLADCDLSTDAPWIFSVKTYNESVTISSVAIKYVTPG